MRICHEWAVEVDQDHQRLNLAAQERFIVRFIGSLYEAIEASHPALSAVHSLHFTRIFKPSEDKMGAYIRLRLFVQEEHFRSVEQEVDSRLEAASREGMVFQVRKQQLDWERVAEPYGGKGLASTFRDYLSSISKISYELLCAKQEGCDLDRVIWAWTHFFFNSIRGYGRSVLELRQGAVTGFHPNV